MVAPFGPASSDHTGLNELSARVVLLDADYAPFQ
jgi:hypothetical protein